MSTHDHFIAVPFFERMVKCTDVTVQQLSLQALEMLALSAPDNITPHTSLIPVRNRVCLVQTRLTRQASVVQASFPVKPNISGVDKESHGVREY